MPSTETAPLPSLDEQIQRVRFALEEAAPPLDWIRLHESGTHQEVKLGWFMGEILNHSIKIIDLAEHDDYTQNEDDDLYSFRVNALSELLDPVLGHDDEEESDTPYSEAAHAIYLASFSARELAQGYTDDASRLAEGALDSAVVFKIMSEPGWKSSLDMTDAIMEQTREQESRWIAYQASHPIVRPIEPVQDETAVNVAEIPLASPQPGIAA